LVFHTKAKTRLRVSVNRVLRSIFGPKREELAGGWWRLHDEDFITRKLHQVKGDQIKDAMDGACSTHRDMRNAYNILVGEPEGKTSLVRSRHRWEDNSRMDLREIEWQGADWIHLTQDTDQCQHSNEPSGFMTGREFLDWLSDC
jgi:hypothetical protein